MEDKQNKFKSNFNQKLETKLKKALLITSHDDRRQSRNVDKIGA